MERTFIPTAAFVAVILLTFGGAATSVSADEVNPETPSVAPEAGDPTTVSVPFSVPVSFASAVSASASYSGTVVAIHYENPEVSGEYSFASGQTPTEFEAEFALSFGTTPAATALIVASTVPEDPGFAGRSAFPGIEVSGPAFVPEPATFSQKIEDLIEPPAQSEIEAAVAARESGDWRPDQADAFITTYSSPNRVDISTSYWWLGADSPALTPSGWGVEFEVVMKDPNGDIGTRGSCMFPNGQIDNAYKTRLAAQNQNWNWQAIRPDGVTAPSSLGAYADYNDLFDPCNQASFAIGLRYPQNIQYVNGAYGIVFSISAPKGTTATSVIGGGTQAVYDGLCNVWPYSLGAKTDCMGALAGTWPYPSIPHATGTLSMARGWTGPKLCWFSDQKGQVAPINTSGDC